MSTPALRSTSQPAARRSVAYVPYLFVRELRERAAVKNEEWDDPELETKLPYIAFLQRHQSRWSRFWEDGDGEMSPFDFWQLLRSIFVARAGSPEEAELLAAGGAIAAQMNRAEDKEGCVEAEAVGDCEDIIEGWPSWESEWRIPLWVVAHDFNAWNHREYVWRDIRKSPVRFQPIPAPDMELLNRWLFGRYRFPKDSAAFLRALQAAPATAKRQNSPRALVANGMLAALDNGVNLVRFAERTVPRPPVRA